MKNSMHYAFYFMTTANACSIFLIFFLWNLKAHVLVLYYVFSNFVSFGPKLQVYNFIYMALYSLQANLMLQKCKNKKTDLKFFINHKQSSNNNVI